MVNLFTEMAEILKTLAVGERRQAIADLILEAGSVMVDCLVERFEVSRMTIHRDLDQLEDQGVLRKVRSGATALPANNFESDVRFRLHQQTEAKQRLAEAALEHLGGVQSVCLDDATTLLPLARLLAEIPGTTVISNFLPIIKELTTRDTVKLIALGGEYRARFDTFTGLICEQVIQSLRLDVFVTSTTAVCDGVAYHPDPEIVKVKRAMMAAATRKILLVDNSKFGKAALHRVAGLEEFDLVVMESSQDSKLIESCESAGISVCLAKENK
jgi:DeoR/GlpR family transcriptional regulator of sugar metabolism